MHHVEARRRKTRVVRVEFDKLRRPRHFTVRTLRPCILQLVSTDISPDHRPSRSHLLRNPVRHDARATCEIENPHPSAQTSIQHHLSCRSTVNFVLHLQPCCSAVTRLQNVNGAASFLRSFHHWTAPRTLLRGWPSAEFTQYSTATLSSLFGQLRPPRIQSIRLRLRRIHLSQCRCQLHRIHRHSGVLNRVPRLLQPFLCRLHRRLDPRKLPRF